MLGISERLPPVSYPGAYVNNLIENRHLLKWPPVIQHVQLFQYRNLILVPPETLREFS